MIETQGRRADVPPAAVPDPRLRRGQRRDASCGAGRGGLMFMLIIWLQGIWLPDARLQLRRHAAVGGIYMLPLIGRLPGRRPVRRAASPTASARGRSRPAGCSSSALGFLLLVAAAGQLLLSGCSGSDLR